MANVSRIWPSINCGENGDSRIKMTQNPSTHSVDTSQDISRPQDARRSICANSYPEESISGVNLAIFQLDQHILNTEEKIEEVQNALRIGGECCGEKGSFLVKEKDRLVFKEQQLRREKEQLREEKIILLKGVRSEGDGACGE